MPRGPAGGSRGFGPFVVRAAAVSAAYPSGDGRASQRVSVDTESWRVVSCDAGMAVSVSDTATRHGHNDVHSAPAGFTSQLRAGAGGPLRGRSRAPRTLTSRKGSQSESEGAGRNACAIDFFFPRHPARGSPGLAPPTYSTSTSALPGRAPG
ncbi:hypothetical protein K488DRAFT_92502 [Vararia minispora EC-137]|uniref:Uncharacterized protein n=1 Tax=Vararia minispora EC-137 TaxID=1314806 RepID=A0ACB8Q4C9_9AGAM|nr:hypothetical protein K488DRAFT_92502 [Vararia minispora EC-137]